MRQVVIVALLIVSLFFACSKSEKSNHNNQEISLISKSGKALAQNLDDFKLKILNHLVTFDKELNASENDIQVLKVDYFDVSVGVSAKISFDVKGQIRTIVIGRGNLPKFIGNIRGFTDISNNSQRTTGEGTCVEYSASCAGQQCCDVEGIMGSDGKMTFRCLCSDCTLNIKTKTTLCD